MPSGRSSANSALRQIRLTGDFWPRAVNLAFDVGTRYADVAIVHANHPYPRSPQLSSVRAHEGCCAEPKSDERP